ncbi:MAG: ATP-binding protein [Proteobacteria bacterium]|nr:ATP-binding protein [Pseudomonadota bacterium]MBS0494930.1 ATP-binding protein [Pseudomonadota bacterium]
MFRTRPPVYALACVALSFIQLIVNAWLIFADLEQVTARHWLIFNVLISALLALLILLQVPRALQWRPRRSVRPSHELKLERQRISRDLHDQVGSQLVHAIAMIDAQNPATQPLVQALEHCLLDVRLLVDSMDGDDDALIDRLARLRHRIQPSLNQRGIALDWDMAFSGSSAMPVGAPARELTAIVQEAVSNVLQHSGASAVAIRLQQVTEGAERAWRLQVSDNGKGLPAAALNGQDAGHGIAGMRQRAARAGGRLELLPGQGQGLCVQVTVPTRP